MREGSFLDLDRHIKCRYYSIKDALYKALGN